MIADSGTTQVAPGVQFRLPALSAAQEGAANAESRSTWTEEPASALPVIDLSSIAGARITLRRGFVEELATPPAATIDGEPGALAPAAARLRLRALCATAPSGRWAPGVEELVLDGASWLARGAVVGTIERWNSASHAWIGDHLEQRFDGVARHGAEALSIRGRHLLGFAGEDRVALLCSVICAEPAQGSLGAGHPERCAPLVDAVALEGALAPPPPPSLLVQGMLAAAEHPYPAVAALNALGVLAVAILLARRPRPRPIR